MKRHRMVVFALQGYTLPTKHWSKLSSTDLVIPPNLFNCIRFSWSAIRLISTPQEVYTDSLLSESSIATIISWTIKEKKQEI